MTGPDAARDRAAGDRPAAPPGGRTGPHLRPLRPLRPLGPLRRLGLLGPLRPFGPLGPLRPLRPLLPPSARRPAAAAAIGCAVVTLVLAILVAHTSRPDAVDRAVDSWIIARLSGYHRPLVLLMDLGEPVQVTITTVILAAACLAARRVNGAVLAAVSVSVTAVLTELVLKRLVGRTLGSFTVYPSGHTSRAFSLALVIIVLLLRPAAAPGGRRLLRRAAMAACLALAAGVGVAMIDLGYHYFTDTVGGAAAGAAVVLATTFLLDRPGVLRRWGGAAYCQGMQTWDAITSRRNVRAFADRPIPAGDLDRILQAGWRSPSSQNWQPWDFVLVTDQEQLQQLSGVFYGAHHVAHAAAAIAVIAPLADNEFHRAQFDLGQATMSMTLAAADLGIGSCHAGVTDLPLARQVLGLPEDRTWVLLLSLGYPADRPLTPVRNPNRRPFDEVVHRGRW